MTRAEETARVRELRAAFAASDEPDVFRFMARRELADPQSAAEPARERGPDPLLAAFAPWEDVVDMEAFDG